MLGVLLLSGILCAFSIILLSDQIILGIEKITSTQASPNQFYTQALSMCRYCQQEDVKQKAGYIAFLFGIWTLFGPDFGSVYGGMPILGALIPALVLCLDAFILNPTILQWAPLAPYRDKLDYYINQLFPAAGWITLATSVAHSLFYYLPFF